MRSILRLVVTLLTWIALWSRGFVFGAVIKPSAPAPSSSSFPETAGVRPIPCHSHNDYLRTHPLIDALENGCISVEADIWQKDDMKDDLRVGHTEGSLKDDVTLKSLYVEPIIARLAATNGGSQSLPSLQAPWNGIFLENKTQTLVLLIDFKTAGDATWSTLMSALNPLRDGGWLSYWDIQQQRFIPRPVTMVASGLATIDYVAKTTFTNGTLVRRDIFLDAPLADLGTSNQYNPSNSYYASTDFAKSSESTTIKSQIAAANKLSLISRYWDAPDDRDSPKEKEFWEEILKDDVGIFNTDHLTTFKNWWEGIKTSSVHIQ